MQRITLKILIASLTFIVGVGLATAWFYIRHRPLSLCSLSENPAPYVENIIRMRGELYVNPNGMIQLNGIECGLRSSAWADVSFTENPKLIEDLRQLSGGDNFAKADVVLTGKFTERKWHCFAARFEISDAHLEGASEVSVVNFPEQIKKEDARNGD
jgi:hypothetical protein